MIEDSFRLDGRVIVVAGAGGGGIGTAVCAAIADAHGQVLAIDNDAERLAIAAALGDAVTPCLADARDPATIADALAGAGTLHGLVHVAGGLDLDQWERTEQISLATFDDVLALNLRAAFVTSQAVAARLIVQPNGLFVATGDAGPLAEVDAGDVILSNGSDPFLRKVVSIHSSG